MQFFWLKQRWSKERQNPGDGIKRATREATREGICASCAWTTFGGPAPEISAVNCEVRGFSTRGKNGGACRLTSACMPTDVFTEKPLARPALGRQERKSQGRAHIA